MICGHVYVDIPFQSCFLNTKVMRQRRGWLDAIGRKIREDFSEEVKFHLRPVGKSQSRHTLAKALQAQGLARAKSPRLDKAGHGGGTAEAHVGGLIGRLDDRAQPPGQVRG